MKTPTGKKPPVIKTDKGLTSRDEAEEQAAKMRAIYLDKDPKPKGSEVGRVESMRERILGLSLFPNLYNHKFILKYG